jgi:arsenite methyltransferase
MTVSKTLRDLSAHEIRDLVRHKYSDVALRPDAKYRFRVGKEYALDLLYPAEVLDRLPETMTRSFTGVSSYLARFEKFAEGDIVLELGSGGGLDTAFLAQKVGPAGKVIGVDLSPAMVERARWCLKEMEITSASLLQGEAEELPLADDSVDWVVSNGIFNLSPEKEKILSEIHRILKPESRILCSEIVLQQDPSPEERLNEDDWFK